MNDNIDLTKILKDCPKGTKLYSPQFGEVYFREIRSDDEYSIITTNDVGAVTFTKEGFYRADADEECVLFASEEQRDWSKFTAPWYKKDKFDPKTLQPFDKVITKFSGYPWKCDIFSYYRGGRENKIIACYCTSEDYVYDRCIPYNEDTKHLVGTMEEAPEYYRYWED